MLVRPSTPARSHVPAILLGAAGLLLAGGVVGARLTGDEPDGCDVRTSGLDGQAKLLVARRVLACKDYEHGRISKPQYQHTIAQIDRAFDAPARGRVTWASSVLGYSTQYSETSWSAQQALGAPNVYPQHGDLAQAWASQSADGHAEWIELGYDTPVAASAVEIFETFNPGAVETVELITTSGRRIELRPASAQEPVSGARRLVIATPCTSEPIAAVRVNLASQAVAGWNEIDAVGLVACADPTAVASE